MGGHRAVIFDRFDGVKPYIKGEGTHLLIPWVQRPIIFDCRSRPRNVPVVTGSKDLQNVNITLRILFRPVPEQLTKMYTSLGMDYDELVLPSITNEVLKTVVAQFNAGELITNREMVSQRVNEELTDRASQFGLILDDISLTHLTFGKEFTAAVELKQVAQQEAEKARFLVEKAEQQKIAEITTAEGDSQAAQMLAKCGNIANSNCEFSSNCCYMEPLYVGTRFKGKWNKEFISITIRSFQTRNVLYLPKLVQILYIKLIETGLQIDLKISNHNMASSSSPPNLDRNEDDFEDDDHLVTFTHRGCVIKFDLPPPATSSTVSSTLSGMITRMAEIEVAERKLVQICRSADYVQLKCRESQQQLDQEKRKISASILAKCPAKNVSMQPPFVACLEGFGLIKRYNATGNVYRYSIRKGKGSRMTYTDQQRNGELEEILERYKRSVNDHGIWTCHSLEDQNGVPLCGRPGCQKEWQFDSNWKRHSTVFKFYCGLCDSEFATIHYLRDHWTNKHSAE